MMNSDIATQNTPVIPSVDLQAFVTGTRQEQLQTARQVDDTCRKIGFLVVENHGVAKTTIDAAWSALRLFFDLPLEEKLKARSADPYCPRGYFPMEAEALAKSLGVESPPDIKERFGIGPMSRPPQSMSADDLEFHCGDNLWPDEPMHLRASLTAYFNAMETLGAQLMQLFAAALKLPHEFFDQYHTHPRSALSCINYPYSDMPLLPEQKGAGEHSDYGTLTILKPDPLVGGLEIKLPTGQWAAAPLVGNKFIINVGDLMARWTNDRWVSTLHRVVQPTSNADQGARRQSMAFFQNTNFDAKIECIPTCLSDGERARYKPVLAGDYLKERFTAAVN